MSGGVHIYDTASHKWWRSPGLGYTSEIGEAFPWKRETAELIVSGHDWLEIREIRPEDILI